MLRGLHNDRMINDLVYEEANELRLAGNDAAHGDFFEELFEAGNDTADDAKEFLGFMHEVLSEVFQRPTRVKQRQEQRKARKEARQERRQSGEPRAGQ